jgi:hypothetical protein
MRANKGTDRQHIDESTARTGATDSEIVKVEVPPLRKT